MRWELIHVDQPTTQHVAVNKLLKDGWEPFSYGVHAGFEIMWFRRQVDG